MQKEKATPEKDIPPLLRSQKCNRKCNLYTVTPSHSAQLDATTKKVYSSLLSRLSSLLPEVGLSSDSGCDWSRKLLSWQRDRGFDPHPLRQTKLVCVAGVPGASVLFIWFVLFVWFKGRKKPKEPDKPDQPVSLFICAFSFNARLSSTIAKVSRAQYRSRASSIVARSTQSVSTKTMR
jgi:hypothetical protein